MPENKTGPDRIVVLGGSFNPPTLAHFKLMQAALDMVCAQLGIFVPVSHAYLKRKMRDSEKKMVCLSEAMRLKMLEAMCATDPRMAASDMEYGRAMTRTYDTAEAIQAQYPKAEVYLLFGADKLDLFLKFAKQPGFWTRFHGIVVCRQGIVPEEQLNQDEDHRTLRDSFIFMEQPEEVTTISSTVVRNRMLSGESSEELLHPAVWQWFRQFSAADFPEEIDQFTDRYAFLSNSYAVPVVWQGRTFCNAEAAFQSTKCATDAEKDSFMNYDAQTAKQRGSKRKPSPEWDARQISIMEGILRAKFTQNNPLAQELARTGNAVLINGTNGKNTFWGVDLYSWQGENQLGKLLMRLRAEL